MNIATTQTNLLPKSTHAIERQRTRFISDDEIEYALRFGTRFNAAGVTYYHVLSKDIQQGVPTKWASRVHGVTVVVSRDRMVLTAYRAPGAYRELKKRPKWAHA